MPMPRRHRAPAASRRRPPLRRSARRSAIHPAPIGRTKISGTRAPHLRGTIDDVRRSRVTFGKLAGIALVLAACGLDLAGTLGGGGTDPADATTPIDGSTSDASGSDGALDAADASDGDAPNDAPDLDAAQANCLAACDGGTCDGGFCMFSCAGINACAGRIVCPANIPCVVECNGTNACAGG